MNVYMVWTADKYENHFYMLIAAETRQQARYEYASFGDWEDEMFQNLPKGMSFHCNIIENGVEYERGDVTYGYTESRGVDLIMEGVIEPNWMMPEFSDQNEYYNHWNGFRKVAATL